MDTRKVDAVIVGAGFAGLYMLHRLREQGLTVKVIEAASGVGGTWFWNRYPGARCDIESMEYSYQFSEELQQEWKWSEKYSPQAEILDYANHVADRFDLRRDIVFNTSVERAHFDETTSRWEIQTSDGSWSARHCVMATGCLSAPTDPDFAGFDSFKGNVYRTSQWPHEGVDFTGQRVGVIGTGSSAIQSIPVIAEQAARLTVFQRTANFSIPAHNEALDPTYEEMVKADYRGFRERNAEQLTGFGSLLHRTDLSAKDVTPEERAAIYEESWAAGGLPFMNAFADLLFDKESNDTASDFVRAKIRSIVNDPDVADLLSPDTVVACKRLCVDTNYFATFNQDHVHLVDVSENPIKKFTPNGLATGGTDFEFDAIVLATGFDAMTGALDRIDIRGRGGLPLKSKWHAGPITYLGLGTAGFPNLFIITGPGSPSVLTNMLPSIEQHVEWIDDCIGWLDENGLASIEPTEAAEAEWVGHVNEMADLTLFPTCNSWYLGSNVPGKPRVFMPYLGFPAYVEKCNEVVANGYEGFATA